MNLTINELERRLYIEGRAEELAQLESFRAEGDWGYYRTVDQAIAEWPVLTLVSREVLEGAYP